MERNDSVHRAENAPDEGWSATCSATGMLAGQRQARGVER
jgi:hypothetical protein